MVWFKVDDGWLDHPKVLGLSLAARGLWISAGVWCARHLTDGFFPVAALALCKGSTVLADALCRAGLWSACDGGWRFHDWETHQPTKAKVIHKRTLKTQRQQRWRDRVDASTPRLRDAPVDVLPTRPDPTRPVSVPSEQSPSPSATVPRKRAGSSKKGPRPVEETTETNQLRVAFQEAYREHYGGAEHGWDARCGSDALWIVSQPDGLAGALERMRNGFDHAPKFIREGGAFDIHALRQFYKKLALPAEAVAVNGKHDIRKEEFQELYDRFLNGSGERTKIARGQD